MYFALPLLVVAGLLAFVIVFVVPRVRRVRHRARLLGQPLPVALISILERNVPLYRKMPADLKEELRGYVNVFLHDKQFFGCDGLEVTDEMRVTVAGNACVLLLNRDADHFPGFTSILLYPDSFVAQTVHYDGDIEIVGHEARAGESWYRGPIVLSWGDVQRGVQIPDDGKNVVLHEFAHKLDEEDSLIDGLPVLREKAHYQEWADVLTREFAAQRERVERHRSDVLDEYGATEPAEFFAVATETFFEKGRQMKKRLPDLYEQLRKFYGVDPASW